MKTSQLIAGCMAAWLGGAVLLAADVRQGLVSYWPLDAMSEDFTTTTDLVSGYDLNTVNWFDTSGVVPGKRGNAFQFDGTSQYAYRTMEGLETDRLPISKAASFTVMFWVKAAPNQSDRRVFSESNSLLSDNDPLVNIGTHNAGTDGTIDLFFRNSTGGVQLNHLHSPGTAYDNTWHHVALVDVSGAVTLYLDGTNTMTATYTREATPIQDTLSIGAIVRGNGSNIGARFTGTIDDVAVWERALSMEEIQDVMNNGIQTPVPAFGPFITRDPAGSTKLRVGDTFTLTAAAGGVRPLTYQWFKGETAIPDATSPTLALTDLQVADSGEYKLRVTNSEGTAESAAATLVVSPPPEPNLISQVVALWRLDEVQGTKTPDIVSGYDMDLVNLTAADVVPGKWGQCFQFDAARQTMLKRNNIAGENLPIYQHPDFSVSLWVKGRVLAEDGITILQTDRRVFSEGSTKTTNPLFNIGTHNSATAPDETVDIYIRTDSGAVIGDHHHSVGIAFDGTWHHILYTQRDLGGTMAAHLYVDGVLDTMRPDPVRPLTLDTTTIGGILRNAASAWFTGQIDDVIVWNRGLTGAEAQLLATTAMPDPPPNVQPLAISAFRSDMPQVVEGDSVLLR
ncbi:MAG TPA: LamG domain-containing protein, partial [Candidatus Paceibacterota bacterium]|nr:LamG domain-containing protein [Candidatus Paceibacterota bacterium]